MVALLTFACGGNGSQETHTDLVADIEEDPTVVDTAADRGGEDTAVDPGVGDVVADRGNEDAVVDTISDLDSHPEDSRLDWVDLAGDATHDDGGDVHVDTDLVPDDTAADYTADEDTGDARDVPPDAPLDDGRDSVSDADVDLAVFDADGDTGVEPGCVGRRDLLSALPSNTWAYELVPNVILDDGEDKFMLEVFVNDTGVNHVEIRNLTILLVNPDDDAGELHDDGLGADRVAGDGVFSAGPFYWNTESGFAIKRYLEDAESPTGLNFFNMGQLVGTRDDESEIAFLEGPVFGGLSTSIPLLDPVALDDDAQATDHLLNFCSLDWRTQSRLRFLTTPPTPLTQQAFQYIADDHDFLALYSTYKVERTPWTSRSNYNAGLFDRVRTPATGLGLSSLDLGASFGSAERLQGLLLMDFGDRGINSGNLTHEMLHLWGAFFSVEGLATGAHYSQRSSVGSLLGGFMWEEQDDGSFLRDCQEGRNAAHRASAMDLYTMGLIEGTEVPDTLIAPTEEVVGCDLEPPEPYTTVTIADIQSAYGVRTPGPDTTQRDFRLAFTAESMGRLLTPAEMTFYDLLAEAYTAEVAAEDPDPYVGNRSWTSITRFFGHGATFATDLSLVE